MSVWIGPIVVSNALLYTLAKLPPQWNYACVRTVCDTLQVLVIFELTSRTGAVTGSVCCIEIRLCCWTCCNAFLICDIVVQYSRHTTQGYRRRAGSGTNASGRVSIVQGIRTDKQAIFSIRITIILSINAIRTRTDTIVIIRMSKIPSIRIAQTLPWICCRYCSSR